jgi:hypothetical protein
VLETRAADDTRPVLLMAEDEGLCRKVAFWSQNPKMGSRKINGLGASTLLFSMICDRARRLARQQSAHLTPGAGAQ